MAEISKRGRKARPQPRRKPLAPRKTSAPHKSGDATLKHQLAEALERQTATAEILKVISSSPTGLQPVFDCILDNATRLCDAHFGILGLYDGEKYQTVAHRGGKADYADYLISRAGFEPPPGTPLGRLIAERQPIHIADSRELPAYRDRNPNIVAMVEMGGVRTYLVVPMIKEGRVVGGISIYRPEVRPFTQKQIDLVGSFADQALIAIENVRLFKELEARNRDVSDALEQQTATAEILKVISGSPTNVQPVFDAIVNSAALLFAPCNATIRMRNGETLERVASAGPRQMSNANADELKRIGPVPFDADRSTSARAIMERRTIAVPDTEAPELGELVREIGRAAGHRSITAVPLMRTGEGIGTIILTHAEAGFKLSEKQLFLLKTFADQAVIAIENVRLFNETKESLERQTATAEILKVIASSPTDVQPVFDAVAQSALRLFGGHSAAVTRVIDDQLHLAAHTATNSAGDEYLKSSFPRPLSSVGKFCAAVRTGKPTYRIDIEDDDRDGGQGKAVGRAQGFRSILIVPMLRGGVSIGTISVARVEAGPFTDHQVSLLETFADQAVIAIQNVRLFNETKESLERQTATAEILKVISSSPTDVQPVFDAIVTSARQLIGGHSAVVTRLVGDELQLAAFTATDGLQVEALKKYYPLPISRGVFVGRAIRKRAPVYQSDTENDPDITPESRELARTRGYRSLLLVPLIREGDAIGLIHITRREPGFFSEHQISLLKTFADQAVIAIENVRLFNETKEALEQQTATAEILKVISGSTTEVQPVFEAIARSGVRLFGTAMVVRLAEGDRMIRVADLTPESPEIIRGAATKLDDSSFSGRAILRRQVVLMEDISAETWVSEETRKLSGDRGYRSGVYVPMMRDNEAIGAIGLMRKTVGPFPEKQVDLLKTFADQAVIAIENVRLFNETKEALERQTATAEILRVIASSPSDVQPVFDAIAASARRLLDGGAALVARRDGDLLQLAAYTPTNAAADAALEKLFPTSITGKGHMGKAVLSAGPVSVDDLQNDTRYSEAFRASARTRGLRSAVSVPMLRDGEAIGVISVNRPVAGRFSEHQTNLLETFADQAVIAIQNVRLFNETKEALERQTATAEILRVIGGAMTDARPVFDAIVRNVQRLFGTRYVGVFLPNEGNLEIVAFNGDPGFEKIVEAYPRPLNEQTIVGKAMLSRQVLQLAPIIGNPETPPGTEQYARDFGYNSIIAVPLMRDGAVVGGIGAARREPVPFDDRQVALIRSFADQAVIAIENVRLFKELQSRTEALTRSVGQLTALGEVGQAISSSLDIEKVLKTVVTRAVKLTGLDGGVIYEYDPLVERFELRASKNFDQESVSGLRGASLRVGEGAVGRSVAERKPIQVHDTHAPDYPPRLRELLDREGFRALLAVPLLREDQIIGALLMLRREPGPFGQEIIELLNTLSSQSALAIQNARLFREIGEKGRQLEEASRHKSQFLASMSHELRTPLNAILGFNEMILDRIYGEVPAELNEPLEDIQKSGKHLLRLINNVLDLAKIEAGRMELALADYSVHDTVESVRSTLRPLAAEKGLEFVTALPDDLPLAYGDFGRITQCLMNLAGNSLKFTKAGKVEISVELQGALLVYRVSDTGMGIPPDKIDSLFTEFKQTDATIASEYGGTGLGLSISRKFIEMHGGRIWVESELGKGSHFIFQVPLRAEKAAA